MLITCIIVDDEPPARDELAYLLSLYDDIKVIETADSASRAIAAIKKHQPDLVFLDIQMPGKSGFEVLPELSELEKKPLFIFATAFDQYAIKAFEENAVDYLLKPFSKERIGKSLERVRTLIDKSSNNSAQQELFSILEKLGKKKEITRISVENKGRIVLLDPEDIIFCQYESKKVTIHTESGLFKLYGISTMDKLEKHLEAEPFFRCHRISLVNLNHIKEFSPWFNGKYMLKMNDKKESEIIVSRSRVKDFKIKLGI